MLFLTNERARRLFLILSSAVKHNVRRSLARKHGLFSVPHYSMSPVPEPWLFLNEYLTAPTPPTPCCCNTEHFLKLACAHASTGLQRTGKHEVLQHPVL
jgi:hypothetical protein